MISKLSQLWYEVSYETLPTEDNPGTREISHVQGLSLDRETAIKEATSTINYLIRQSNGGVGEVKRILSIKVTGREKWKTQHW